MSRGGHDRAKRDNRKESKTERRVHPGREGGPRERGSVIHRKEESFLDAPGSAVRPEEINDDHGWTPDQVEEGDQLGSLMQQVRRRIESQLEKGTIIDQRMMGDLTHAKYTQHRCCRSLSPLSNEMKRWDVVSVLLLGFTALVTPFEIAFMETQVDVLFAINRLVDLGFLYDLIVNFRLAYMDKSGSYEFTPSKIRMHYLRGWFSIDFISLIPWDLVAMIVEAQSSTSEVQDLKILRLLKILKLTKMIRIVKTARVFKRLQTDLGINNTNKQLLKYLMIIIAAMHWTACGWGMMATFSDDHHAYWATQDAIDDGNATAHRLLKGSASTGTSTTAGIVSSSWLRRYEDENSLEEPLPISDVFALCLEYSLSVMCMGYATIMPITSEERWFSLMMMLFAGSVYAYVIGGICSAVAAEDGASLEFKENMDTLMLFFRNIALPEDLKMRAYEYLNYCEHMFRDESHRDVLMLMPPSIRGDICVFQHSENVHKIPFLKKCFEPVSGRDSQTGEQTKLLSFICLKLSQKAYPPREVVYLRNDPATDVYIITRGVVKISGGFIRVPQYLSAGMNFGSDMLMTPGAQRVHAVKSVSYSTHAVLAAEDLFELQETKAYLFEIASRSMRLHRNILKCAYTMQKFGKMVRKEVMTMCAETDGLSKTDATKHVTAKYRALVWADNAAPNRGLDDISDRATAARVAQRLTEVSDMHEGGSPIGSRSTSVVTGQVVASPPRLTAGSIEVNGVMEEKLTVEGFRQMLDSAANMPLAELFKVQQRVAAQTLEWATLEKKLADTIQLRATKEVAEAQKKIKDADKKQRRTSFAD